MGKLVQFDSRGKAGHPAKPDRPIEAEILIFTGVRYERQTSVDSPNKPTASSRGKRKRG
jgi:hypothetical protein